MEILAKFGAALQGFWWGLDPQERLLVLAAGASVAFTLLSAAGEKRGRDELADSIADRVTERLAANGR